MGADRAQRVVQRRCCERHAPRLFLLRGRARPTRYYAPHDEGGGETHRPKLYALARDARGARPTARETGRSGMTDERPIFIEPCRSTSRRELPVGDGWLHEVKFDGFRLQVHKDGRNVFPTTPENKAKQSLPNGRW